MITSTGPRHVCDCPPDGRNPDCPDHRARHAWDNLIPAVQYRPYVTGTPEPGAPPTELLPTFLRIHQEPR